jgi:hypothetical protein
VDVFEDHHLIARPRWLPEIELHDAPLPWRLDLLDFLERLHPALHLCRLGGVGREPIDETLFLREHRLLPGIGGFLVRVANGALAFVEVVIARIGGDLAAIDFRDAGHGPVQELAIVRGHQQRAGLGLEKRFEPDDRLDVEVVGRLVHQEHVGPPEQHAGHGDAHLPSTGQRTDIAVDAIVVEPEPVENFTRLALERVAAEVFVLFLHFTKTGQNAIHVCGAIRIGHRVVQRFELVMQVPDPSASRDRLVENRAAGHLLDVLAEVADGQLPGYRNVPFIGRLFADDHAKERRLAGAVRADEADLFTGIELERGVHEQHLTPVLLGDMRKRNHSESFSVARSRPAIDWLECRCGNGSGSKGLARAIRNSTA